MQTILNRVQYLYPDQYEQVYNNILALVEKWSKQQFSTYPWVDQSDVLMITYGDGIRSKEQSPLQTLSRFADEFLQGYINIIHLLPMFPYTSDDGFSVSDFREINPDLGSWSDVEALSQNYDLMFDAVINHVSASSKYFQEYLKCTPEYQNFFITADPSLDYSLVTRPRTLPLLTPFSTKDGVKHVWTTFSEDQIDLNFKEPKVLLEILDILLMYAAKGARFLRYDAIGFAWKELGTTCMQLPQTHELIKLTRDVLQLCSKGCTIITETNVPHQDNISYFGNGHDEASMVYQFPLPPLTLYSFLSGNADKLTQWAAGLEPTSCDTAYFNFLASHDGIGMRPVEDILTQLEKSFMENAVLERGGQIGYRTLPDGSQVAYELNINYLDAVAGDLLDAQAIAQKFLASQCVLMSMMGMPAIYYHSLLGSRNCYQEYESSGIKRRINREKLDLEEIRKELSDPTTLRHMVFTAYTAIIGLRKTIPAFAPNSPQQVLSLDNRIFALLRGEKGSQVLVLINVSNETVTLHTHYMGTDAFTGRTYNKEITVSPYQYMWIQL